MLSSSTDGGPADCDAGSLRAQGWRQGCCIDLEMPLVHLTVKLDGSPNQVTAVHGRWVVVSQDCELAWTDAQTTDPVIELRPVFVGDGSPSVWGVRSKQFTLSDTDHLDGQAPRQMVAPKLLGMNASRHVTCCLPDMARALKTWLGYRYDRPAVPGEFVDLHTALSGQFKKKSNANATRWIRDVLVVYRVDIAGRAHYLLYAVLPSSGTPRGDEAAKHQDEVETLLADVALKVKPEVGVADEFRSVPADNVSLAFVEGSYALDTLDVSWRRSRPAVTGEVR